MTYEIAQAADYLIQPVNPYLDDLEPAVIDFNSLVEAGINSKKFIFILNRVMSANSEKDARDYLGNTDYHVLENSLPDRLTYAQVQNEG
jgi:hypothetical protein